MKIIYSL